MISHHKKSPGEESSMAQAPLLRVMVGKPGSALSKGRGKVNVRTVPDTLKVSLCFLFSWRGPLLHGPGHATEFRTKRILTHEGPSDAGVSHAYTY